MTSSNRFLALTTFLFTVAACKGEYLAGSYAVDGRPDAASDDEAGGRGTTEVGGDHSSDGVMGNGQVPGSDAPVASDSPVDGAADFPGVSDGPTTKGGVGGSGGADSSGLIVASGGATGSDASVAPDGTIISGGAFGTGGDISLGGTRAGGGMTGRGGDISLGGTTAGGGMTGGTTAGGGMTGRGGDISLGGTTAPGGVTGAGGLSLLGGTTANSGMTGMGATIASGGTGTGGVMGTGGTTPSGGTSGGSPRAPENYMILIDDQFVGNARLQEFVEWKSQKGYQVSTVTTSMIDSGGAPSHAQIVGYMNGLSETQYPRYLLIVGDADAANGVAAFKFQSAGVPAEYSGHFAYPQQYTDKYIVSKNGSTSPTVFAGRLPASNTAELTLMLDKVLLMDRTPPDPATTNMYNQLVVAGEIWPVSENGKYVDHGAFAEIQDAAATYFEQRCDGFPYQVSLALSQETVLPESTAIYWDTFVTQLWKNAVGTDQVLGAHVLDRYLTGATAPADALQVALDRTNAGVAMLLFVGRGEPNGWWRPALTSSEITANLHNKANLPLVISDAPLTAVYYPPTGDPSVSPGDPFSKSLLTHKDGGAYAVIGATDLLGTTGITHGFLTAFLGGYRECLAKSATPAYTSSLPAPDAQTIGLAEGQATRLGQMLFFAQRYIQEDATYHLLGDPEAFAVLHPPLAQAVSYPLKMAPGPSRPVTVFTGEDGAMVSLYSRALSVRAVGITRNGSVTLPIGASAEGTIDVTVTKYERMPYRGILTVTSAIAMGDVDGNGRLDSVDVNMIADFSVGLPVYNLIPEAADVNCDGLVTSVDTLLVYQMSVGMISAFPCGQSRH